jgi:5-methylcytosine-specific restriction protein A
MLMPTRPPSRCPRAGCIHVMPCPDHTPAPWAGSTRRSTLPKDWDKRRAAVLRRDYLCRCAGCPRCREFRAGDWVSNCARESTDCDHIGDPHDHSLANLRGLCAPCHAHRSGRQGGRSKAAR